MPGELRAQGPRSAAPAPVPLREEQGPRLNPAPDRSRCDPPALLTLGAQPLLLFLCPLPPHSSASFSHWARSPCQDRLTDTREPEPWPQDPALRWSAVGGKVKSWLASAGCRRPPPRPRPRQTSPINQGACLAGLRTRFRIFSTPKQRKPGPTVQHEPQRRTYLPSAQ